MKKVDHLEKRDLFLLCEPLEWLIDLLVGLKRRRELRIKLLMRLELDSGRRAPFLMKAEWLLPASTVQAVYQFLGLLLSRKRKQPCHLDLRRLRLPLQSDSRNW